MLTLWATAARADTFATGIGKDRLAITCDGPAMVDTSCSLELGSPPSATPVRFTTQPAHYVHLLKRGIEIVLETNDHPLRPSPADISLLRGLALDQCHPAAESRGLSGDLLQLCIPAGATSSVVLFMRGLCDRCEFEPLVLKRQIAK